MVPWHPPCALCSLIFSSLILRPIVVTLFQYVSQLSLCPILRIATGLSKSFSVQLSRCSPVSVLLIRFFRFPLQDSECSVQYRSGTSPENDTDFNAVSTASLDALCVLLYDLRSGIHTRLFQTSFRAFSFCLPSGFLPLPAPIDLRFGVCLSASAFSLERR